MVERFVDPGAYVRPGESVLTVADRSTIRIVADVPENDFAVVAPQRNVEIQVESLTAKIKAPISRRTPATDRSTRTIHFEIDVDNRNHDLPVGTTARLSIAVGKPQSSNVIPIQAATLRGKKAELLVVSGDVVHAKEVAVLGEREGLLYLDTSLSPGTKVVLEGRALLNEGDKVTVK